MAAEGVKKDPISELKSSFDEIFKKLKFDEFLAKEPKFNFPELKPYVPELPKFDANLIKPVHSVLQDFPAHHESDLAMMEKQNFCDTSFRKLFDSLNNKRSYLAESGLFSEAMRYGNGIPQPFKPDPATMKEEEFQKAQEAFEKFSGK